MAPSGGAHPHRILIFWKHPPGFRRGNYFLPFKNFFVLIYLLRTWKVQTPQFKEHHAGILFFPQKLPVALSVALIPKRCHKQNTFFTRYDFFNWKKKTILGRSCMGSHRVHSSSVKVIVDFLKCRLVVTKTVRSDCHFFPSGWIDEESRNVALMTQSNRCTLSRLVLTGGNCIIWMVIKLNCGNNSEPPTRWAHHWTQVTVWIKSMWVS